MSTRIIIAATVLLLSASTADAQRRAARKAASPASKVVCKGADVPAGFVAVGVTPSSSCSEGAWVLKRATDDSMTVCDGSPVPDGYSVVDMAGRVECGGLSLRNAMVISRGGSPAVASDSQEFDTQRPVRQTSARASSSTSVEITFGGRDSADEAPKTPAQIAEERARQVNAQARRDLAASAGEVSVGMTREQVVNALGRPSSYDKWATSDGIVRETFRYRRIARRAGQYSSARVELKNGIVTEWVLD